MSANRRFGSGQLRILTRQSVSEHQRETNDRRHTADLLSSRQCWFCGSALFLSRSGFGFASKQCRFSCGSYPKFSHQFKIHIFQYYRQHIEIFGTKVYFYNIFICLELIPYRSGSEKWGWSDPIRIHNTASRWVWRLEGTHLADDRRTVDTEARREVVAPSLENTDILSANQWHHCVNSNIPINNKKLKVS